MNDDKNKTEDQKSGSSCPITKCCAKMKLSCLLKLGALIIFLVYNISGIYAAFKTSGDYDFKLLAFLGGQFVTSIFEPLVLLALAKIISSYENKCTTKECS